MYVPGLFGSGLMDDLFDGFMPTPEDYSRSGNRQMKMKSDLRELADGYELTLQLPGFKKEDIKAELKKGYLTVSATHRADEDKKEGRYVWKESYSGEYIRSFYVGEDLKQDDIKAKFVNGEVVIWIPKKEARKQEEPESFINID